MRTCLIIVWLLSAGILAAQQEDAAVGELLENFFRDNEGASESDAQLWLEQLEQFRQNPLDLNRADRSDLVSLHLLNELQVEKFVRYRDEMGPFLNIYELQAVEDWDLDDIRRILPYIKIGNGGLDERGRRLREGFLHGENELLLRWGRPVDINYPLSAEGTNNALALRYRHSFDGRMRFGFTAENDPGEALFTQSNQRGFDFYSAHFFIQNPANRRLRALALGDFTARMGQGLLLQTGFSPGKSAESVSLLRGGRKLGPYGAFGEVFFLRGAGATFSINRHIEITAFASVRQRDANILQFVDTTELDPQELIFLSLLSSGLHRTPAEIEDERKLTETLGGATITYQHRQGHISLNGLHIGYDRPWEPSPAAYRRYVFTGQNLNGMSLDYQYRRRNLFFFGENARSGNGGTALLNGLLLGLDRRTTLAIVQRKYSPRYQAIYANPFSESTGANNEQGLYLGAEIRPSKPWKINAYADMWKSPWLRFGVSGPSRGHEYLTRVLWQPNKVFQLYGLWQTETKQRDGETGSLSDNQRNRLRLHMGYKVSPTLDLRTRAEWMRFREDTDLPRSKGFLAYQEAVCKPKGFPVSGAVRFAVFDTDDYDTRVYAFENDVFSAVSIPGFAGRGSRMYVNLMWRINKQWRIEGRGETTYLSKAVTSGTAAGRRTVWKLLVQGHW